MKKTIWIIISVVLLLFAAGLGVCGYVTNTPQYALKEMIDDVHKYGLDGLYPHLTEEVKETVEEVSAVSENGFLESLVGYISENAYLDILKSEIQEIQWSVEDVLKSKKNASVILAFNYEDKLTGTIALSMTREDGQWKINGLDIPEFDEISLW